MPLTRARLLLTLATVITQVRASPGKVVVRGTTADNGTVRRVLVNGKEAGPPHALTTVEALGEAPGKKTDEGERKKLVGTWEGYVVEGKGERPEGPVHLRVTITSTTISAIDLRNRNRDMGQGTYRLDPSRPLQELDATGVVLPGKRARTFLGIYQIDGDTLRWCVDNRQKGRPADFRTGGGNYLLVLKRKK